MNFYLLLFEEINYFDAKFQVKRLPQIIYVTALLKQKWLRKFVMKITYEETIITRIKSIVAGQSRPLNTLHQFV